MKDRMISVVYQELRSCVPNNAHVSPVISLALSVNRPLTQATTPKARWAFAAKCGICHETGLGANPFVGPELNGIWGHFAASVPNYTKYSDGFEEAERLGAAEF
jgi:cytochrome c2